MLWHEAERGEKDARWWRIKGACNAPCSQSFSNVINKETGILISRSVVAMRRLPRDWEMGYMETKSEAIDQKGGIRVTFK